MVMKTTSIDTLSEFFMKQNVNLSEVCLSHKSQLLENPIKSLELISLCQERLFLKNNQLASLYNGPSICNIFFHTSFVNEFKDLGISSNESLEFLGDSVIGLILADYLLEEFPSADEGVLSKLRSKCVSRSSLNHLGEFFKLEDLVLLGRGQLNSTKKQLSLSGNLLEAYFGLVFKEVGFLKTKSIFFSMLDLYSKNSGRNFLEIIDSEETFDYKSALQELTHKVFKEGPIYHTTSLSADSFEVRLEANKKVLSVVIDKSKKRAEKEAAKIAYEFLSEEYNYVN